MDFHVQRSCDGFPGAALVDWTFWCGAPTIDFRELRSWNIFFSVLISCVFVVVDESAACAFAWCCFVCVRVNALRVIVVVVVVVPF